MRNITLAAGIAFAAIALAFVLVDEAEVVTLAATDAKGRTVRSQLWIVEVAGATYARAATPSDELVACLRKHPVADVTRNGTTEPASAVPVDDPAIREAVGLAMRRKYGLVDRVYALVRDDTRSVPIRLAPLPAPAEGTSQRPHPAHAPGA